MKKKRPTPITVIAWYLIIVYALALVSIPAVLFMPTAQESFKAMGTPVGLSLSFTFLSSAVMIFSGISMLKGLKLGKNITLVYMPAAMLIGCLINGFQGSVIVGIIIYIVIFIILSGEKTKAYFNHEWIEYDDTVLETNLDTSTPAGGELLVYERVTKGSADSIILTVDLQDSSTTQPGLARKIIGTAFFFLGDTFLITYMAVILPVIFNMPQNQDFVFVGAITFVVILILAGILILIAFLIWGFKHGRRLIELGTFITGAWTVIGAVGLITLPFMPQYRELQELQQSQNIDLTSMGLYMMIAGIFNLIIAACLSQELKKFILVHIIKK